MHAHHKLKVARCFNRAAHTYDDAADLQLFVGRQLLQSIDCNPEKVSRLADIGAGTGMLGSRLHQLFPEAHHHYLDIAKESLQLARARFPNVDYISADFDFLPFKAQAFDFIYSNMTLQWSFCLEKTLLEISRCLQPGGTFAFTLLAAGTLQELVASYQQAGLRSRINRFYSLTEVRMALQQASLITSSLKAECYVKQYKNLQELLNYLKQTGAQCSLDANSAPSMSRSVYQSLSDVYLPGDRDEIGIPATFNVIYAVVRKMNDG